MRRKALLAAILAIGAVQAEAVSAQQPDTAGLRRQMEQQLGTPLTQQDIVERLRASGMTRSQARGQLQAMGYDPALADPYFEAMESGTTLGGQPSNRILLALERLGMTAVPDSALGVLPDSTADRRSDRDPVLDSIRLDSIRSGRLPIFGMSLFENARNQFAPVTFGPVGENYRLGPGDQLVLILTGSVEDAYELRVTRQGFIVIPDVGQLFVAGLTMAELEARLAELLGTVYSGVAREGAGGRTNFQVSLAELRNNQVYLVGEVQEPGAYQVSGVSSVLNALYRAGGPNGMGSFRRIEVRRDGRLVDAVDLYDYLLTGGSREDAQLQNGDRVFVPVVGKRVAIEGEIRRPARYEMLSGETLRDLVAFAGGFRAEAVVQRLQIDRILPVDQRLPGQDRALVDVSLDALAPGAPDIELRDGDRVRIFTISDERRRRVVLTGEVNRPGVYQWTPAMTLEDLIASAEGLAESAYTHRAQVYRLNPADGTRYMIPTALDPGAGAAAGGTLPLEDRDSVVVYSRADLVAVDSVAIRGYVKQPGTYPYAEGMTLEDLILAARGFTAGANTLAAELARLPGVDARSDTAAALFRVPLAGADDGDPSRRPGTAPAPEWQPAAEQVRLQPGDRVFVRQAPGFARVRSVVVTGEVQNPGTYPLADRDERFAEVIARAGGLTTEGHDDGIQLIRDSLLLGVDLAEARRRPDGPANVPLMDGDSIHVPTYDPTVRVSGAVAFTSRVVYVPGKGFDYYIEQAGGYAPQAAPDMASITYQNGERDMVETFGPFTRTPNVRPGSEIYVPAVPAQLRTGISWGDVLARGAALVGTLATLILALQS
jgi:polysaccharide export outer membrane protein